MPVVVPAELTLVDEVVLLKGNKIILKDEHEVMQSHHNFLSDQWRGLIWAQLVDQG